MSNLRDEAAGQLQERGIVVIPDPGYPTAMCPAAVNLAEVESRIHTIRGLSVLLDSDLATLYGVTTKALLQAERRRIGFT